MLRELFRIGEALLVTTGIAGACLGIPIAVFALALKLGTNRNESRRAVNSDDRPVHLAASTHNRKPDHGAR